MTRREHYFWARKNYPDRNAIACWELSLQLLEWERNYPDGAFDEARARQLVAMQTTTIQMAQAVKAISTVAEQLANSISEAMRPFQELASYIGERTGTASGR